MEGDRHGRVMDYGVYSKMMRASFESVRELRMEKFKFSDICMAYAKIGVLPPDADPSSFRKAFRNEAKRRARDLELEKRITDNRTASPGQDARGVGKQEGIGEIKKTAVDTSGQSEKIPDSVTERAMRNTGRRVNIGGTTITKLPDGGFEY